jgi:hypothetical protein
MSDKTLEKIIKKLETLEVRISRLEQGKESNALDSQSDPQKKLSLREFLLSKKPTDDVKKTLAIGYYLEKHEKLSSFNINDLEAAFERAKEKKPTNMNDKVNMNIRNGHLEETSEKKDSRKSWYLTNSGEQYVENGFKAQK